MAATDPTACDALFRQIARPVWVVTAHDGARGGGLAATWVQQASIDPERPSISAAIAVNHFTRELIDASDALAAHLITREQAGLAWRFALGSGRDRDKLAGIAWRAGATGSPILDGCLAWFDARVYDRYDGGDRIYYWADVVDCGSADRGPSAEFAPLTDQELFSLASAEQRLQLRAGLLADIAEQRPLLEAFRQRRKS